MRVLVSDGPSVPLLVMGSARWDRTSLGAVSWPCWALAGRPQSPAFPSQVPPEAHLPLDQPMGPAGRPVASQVEEEMGPHDCSQPASLPPGVRSS